MSLKLSNRNLTETPNFSENQENPPPYLIDVSFNNISLLTLSSFNNKYLITSLKVLNLSNNLLVQFHCEVINQLINLEWLSLSQNKLGSPTSSVPSSVPPASSTVAVFTLKKLRFADISSNNLISCPNFSNCQKLDSLKADKNNFSSLKSISSCLFKDSLLKLNLADNKFKDLSEIRYLTTFDNLENLNLSNAPVCTGQSNLRPFILNWCLSLTQLNNKLVSEQECVKAEWLFTNGLARGYKQGHHEKLKNYLANLSWSSVNKINSNNTSNSSGEKKQPTNQTTATATTPQEKGQDDKVQKWIDNNNRYDSFSEINQTSHEHEAPLANKNNNNHNYERRKERGRDRDRDRNSNSQTITNDHSDEETLLQSESEFIPVSQIWEPKSSQPALKPRNERKPSTNFKERPVSAASSQDQSHGIGHSTKQTTNKSYNKYESKTIQPMSTQKQIELYGQARPKIPKTTVRPKRIQRKTSPVFHERVGGSGLPARGKPVQKENQNIALIKGAKLNKINSKLNEQREGKVANAQSKQNQSTAATTPEVVQTNTLNCTFDKENLNNTITLSPREIENDTDVSVSNSKIQEIVNPKEEAKEEPESRPEPTPSSTVTQDNSLLDLSHEVKNLRVELNAEKKLRQQQTDAIKFLWSIIQQQQQYLTSSVVHSLGGEDSAQSSVANTPRAFGADEEGSRQQPAGLSGVPQHQGHERPALNTHTHTDHNSSLINKKVNFQNVESSTPAKHITDMNSGLQPAFGLDDLAPIPSAANINLIKKNLNEYSKYESILDQDQDVDQEHLEIRRELEIELEQGQDLRILGEDDRARDDRQKERVRSASFVCDKPTPLSKILQQIGQPLPEKILWPILYNTLLYVIEKLEATETKIIHPSSLLIDRSTGQIELSNYLPNLSTTEQQVYLPKSGEESTLFSLSISLWTAADYSLCEQSSPDFSESFGKLLILMSTQEVHNRPSVTQLASNLKENFSHLIEKTTIREFFVDCAINHVFNRFGLDVQEDNDDDNDLKNIYKKSEGLTFQHSCSVSDTELPRSKHSSGLSGNA